MFILLNLFNQEQIKDIDTISSIFDQNIDISCQEHAKALAGIDLLMKDESRWPCVFGPLSFDVTKLKQFLTLSMELGGVNTTISWYDSEQEYDKCFDPFECPPSYYHLVTLEKNSQGDINLKQRMEQIIMFDLYCDSLDKESVKAFAA